MWHTHPFAWSIPLRLSFVKQKTQAILAWAEQMFGLPENKENL